jgi:DNA (cytosine-5)-methyltransferase 1
MTSRAPADDTQQPAPPNSISPDWLAFARGSEAPQGHALDAARTLRTVDLFSSVGGLTLGFRLAAAALGLDTQSAAAVDIDAGALAVHQCNFGTTSTIRESAGLIVDSVIHGRSETARFAYQPTIVNPDLRSLIGTTDVVLAGPPCQGHSNLNNHTRRDDPRNELYLTVPAVAVALNAPVVVIENVPEVTSAKSAVVQTAIALLQGNGYEVETSVIRAVDLGWPQTRRRYFLVATRGWAPEPIADVMKRERQAARGVGWLIDDLLDRTPTSFMDETPELTETNAGRIRLLFDEELFDLPNHARPDCHKDGTTYGATYGRMRWDEPAPTITTGFATPGRGRFVHPLRQRVLTPREAARIQGFPDWFRFSVDGTAPTRSQLTKWIGNAVPTPLGFAAGLAALANSPLV